MEISLSRDLVKGTKAPVSVLEMRIFSSGERTIFLFLVLETFSLSGMKTFYFLGMEIFSFLGM